MLQTVRQIEKVYQRMERELSRFGQTTRVGCPSGCITCCLKPDLEASVLEFLPLAWHLVTTGQHDGVIARIEEYPKVCASLNTLRTVTEQPGCRFYAHRGAICRLFGSAALRNLKTRRNTLYSCKIQKELYADRWEEMVAQINSLKGVPLVTDYYMELQTIDPQLANDYNPINISIRKAINKVELYLSHCPKPGSSRAS